MARALHCVWNCGIEANEVPARALHSFLNTGVQPLPVLTRGLHAVENVGVQPQTVTLGWVDFWNTTAYTSDEDPVEFRLLGSNLFTVEAILRGK